jgi:hypothetical protein
MGVVTVVVVAKCFYTVVVPVVVSQESVPLQLL